MRNIFYYLVIFVLSVFVSACSSDDHTTPLSSDKLLKSFSILKSDNPEKVVNDCEGIISDQTILLRLDKYDCLQGLKPAFKYIGKDVKINRLAIAQGNLTIKITNIPFVSQPEPFTLGEQIVVDTDLIEIEEDTEAKMQVLDTGINLQELVDGLNALGVTPRDLISILQAIKASCALQAEIEVI